MSHDERIEHNKIHVPYFHQYFGYILAVSFIGGGNLSAWRNPPTSRKLLTNIITKYWTPRHEQDSNPQH